MNGSSKERIEYGDWQTPMGLAERVCARLVQLGVRPASIIEPTCGVGAFVKASAQFFPSANIYGHELNDTHLDRLRLEVAGNDRILLERSDFFATDWQERINTMPGPVLVIGNFPWVTNSVQGSIGSTNLPEKSNFLGHRGFDAISGKANFDISESMMMEVLRWFKGREGVIAMLIKTATARKVLTHLQRQNVGMHEAFTFGIDAKKEFNAAVEACLLVLRMNGGTHASANAHTAYATLDAQEGKRVGHCLGLMVNDLNTFEHRRHLLGNSPQRWRSGVKHDLSAVMEFTNTGDGYTNGHGETIQLEPDYLFPLMKGSDIGSTKPGRSKYMLVTQRAVGQATAPIQRYAPRTWAYLTAHSSALDARGSIIYKKNPPFSIFGVGDYAFRPWRIAICGLYKHLKFRLVGPMNGRPVMFDDTVYYVSFNTEEEASSVLDRLQSSEAQEFLSSLIFWDEKRPVKTSVLNLLDWSRIGERMPESLFSSANLFSKS